MNYSYTPYVYYSWGLKCVKEKKTINKYKYNMRKKTIIIVIYYENHSLRLAAENLDENRSRVYFQVQIPYKIHERSEKWN